MSSLKAAQLSSSIPPFFQQLLRSLRNPGTFEDQGHTKIKQTNKSCLKELTTAGNGS